MSYPATWDVIMARPRDSEGTMRESEVLGTEELHKITFQERDGAWPGEYRIRVLANPNAPDFPAHRGVYARMTSSPGLPPR